MATATRREALACPVCSLPLTVVETGEGKSIEYDVNEWARLCHNPDAGSPLACPSLQPLAIGLTDKP